MLISLDWLKDYVDINCSVDELCAKLVSVGFEVEEVIKQEDNCKIRASSRCRQIANMSNKYWQ